MCAHNLSHPHGNQNFEFSYFRDARAKQMDKCLDAQKLDGVVQLFTCHEAQGNQMFKYEYKTKMIYHGRTEHNHCVEANLKDMKLYIKKCDANKDTQKWEMPNVHKENIDNWFTYGQKFL